MYKRSLYYILATLIALLMSAPCLATSNNKHWYDFIPFFHHNKQHQPKAQSNLRYRIVGVEGPVLTNIQKRFDIIVNNLAEPISQQTVKTFYQQGPENIQKAIKPYGYFKATIKKRLVHTGEQWLAIYDVDLGKPIRITHFSIKMAGPGRDNLAFRDLLANFPVQQGAVLSIPGYNQGKQALFDAAQAQGYLDAQLTKHIIKIDLQHYTASVDLVFDTGPRYYFGFVTFSPSFYDNKFLHRFVPFKSGEPYSSNKLMVLQNNLSQSVYFQRVSVTPRASRAKHHHMPVYVLLVPRKAKRYTVGAGYGTDTGFRGSLGFEWRRITRSGHYFQAVLQGSQVQRNLHARYVIPGRNPVTDHYNINAAIANNSPGQGEYTTYVLGGSYTSLVRGWQQVISLSYQLEQFHVFTASPTITTHYLMPSISWQRTHADDRINTNNGYRIYLNIQSGEALNSNNRFIQTELQMKYIRTLLRHTRILLRADLGYTAVKNPDTLPLSVRFFAGGAKSVRGYAYQSLGPGKFLTVGSAEVQQQVWGNWYAAAFYDVGNAFNSTPWHLQRSAGAGVVWRSPLGPLELTVARPLNNQTKPFFKSLKIQFVMGPDL